MFYHLVWFWVNESKPKKGVNIMERIKESPEKRLNNNNEKQFNEISDEAQHEISMAIHASARQSIRPYNSQVILPGQIRSNNRSRSSTPDVSDITGK